MGLKLLGAVESIRFDLLEWKLRNSAHIPIEKHNIPLALEEYKRFLSLKQTNPGVSLSPSELMDAVWHIHILDTKMYAKDCQEIFGRFLHHSPSYGLNELQFENSRLKQARNRMIYLYHQTYGDFPAGVTASICSSACSGVDDFGPDPACGDDDDG
jgi:hypothetical protein